MRYCILVALLFISFPALAQNDIARQSMLQDKGVLIRNIAMEGFMLENKHQFVKLFKPYRNKYLTEADMEEILKEVQVIYEREGYQQLVSITYHVIKHRLVFTVSMIS